MQCWLEGLCVGCSNIFAHSQVLLAALISFFVYCTARHFVIMSYLQKGRSLCHILVKNTHYSLVICFSHPIIN